MSISGRLWGLWTGFLSLWVTNLEVKNPSIAYENMINSLKKDYETVRSTTSALMRRQAEIKERLTTAKQQMLEVTADLSAAVGKDDTLAVVLIEKQEELKTTIEDLEKEFSVADEDAKNGLASLNSIVIEIKKMKSEKDRMLAKLKSAEARQKINDMLDDLSTENRTQAIASVREHINNKVAEANLSDQLRENDIDVRLKKLRATSSSSSAQAKLEQLKQAQAQKVVEQQHVEKK